MTMEQQVESLEKQMLKADERLDNLAVQVGNIENEIFSEQGEEIEVNNLLKSVNDVKNNYQTLRKDLMEVQDLQKQLSSTLQTQLKSMHMKFNILKEKISVNVPHSSRVPMSLPLQTASTISLDSLDSLMSNSTDN